jgi:hypothetical protein
MGRNHPAKGGTRDVIIELCVCVHAHNDGYLRPASRGEKEREGKLTAQGMHFYYFEFASPPAPHADDTYAHTTMKKSVSFHANS